MQEGFRRESKDKTHRVFQGPSDFSQSLSNLTELAQISLAVCTDIKHSHYVTVTTLNFSQLRQKRDGRKCTEPQLMNNKLTNCVSLRSGMAQCTAFEIQSSNHVWHQKKESCINHVCLMHRSSSVSLVLSCYRCWIAVRASKSNTE